MLKAPLTASALLFVAPLSLAGEPAVGATLTIPVASVSISVDGTGRETKRAVYAPPPGWYVRSHRVVATRKTGSVAYAVNTVPAGWEWRAEEQTAAHSKANGGATVSAYKVSGGAQGGTAVSAETSGLQSNASSHHVLVVEVTARGPGLWKGESGVELTVVADLVYLGR